jgi:hypothetical protein
MLKLHRRPSDAPGRRSAPDPPSTRRSVSATSVDPERTEDVAAWMRAVGTVSSARVR